MTDLLKSQLEAIGDILEPASSEIIKYNKNIAATLGNVVKSNYDMLKTVNKKLEELEAQVNFYKVDSKSSVRSSEAQYGSLKQTNNVFTSHDTECKAIFFYKSHFKNPLKNPTSYLVEAGI